MAIEYFLKLDGIKGESVSGKHQAEIELLSWSWGASNATNVSGSGLSAGKVTFADINFTKRVDTASIPLLQACCSGKHITTAVLTCSKSTGDKAPADYLTLKFTEVHVSSYQTGGSASDEVGSESIAMAFGKMEYDYKLQKPDGSLVSAGNMGYDITKRLLT